MNAGAYDGCMADVLASVEVLDQDGQVRAIGVDDLALGYRASRVRTEGLVVLRARIALKPGDPQQIRAKMDDLTRRREEKQPLEYGSAGSTFKRPEGYFAGKLISDAGLKGWQSGGAAVSKKHAGFVVNVGGATAADVHAVIEHVQDEVESQFGVRLEPEVRFLG
jgi:UDP-N-acetylmuramate dehydrogenase